MSEIWRKIPGYSNFEISNLGRVKSKKRVVLTSNGKRYPVREKILKGYFDKSPRGTGWVVGLTNDKGESIGEVIARLLLTTFVRPPREHEVARHLDDNKRNQSLDNLAWGYPKDNTADAFRNGKMDMNRGSRSNFSKLKEYQVLEIRQKYVFKSKEFGVVALGKEYNVDGTLISQIIRRNIWKHI